MRYHYPPRNNILGEHNILFLKSFTILFLSCIAIRLNLCLSSIPSSLKSLPLGGHLNFDEVSLSHAARDFGNRYQYHPMAVLQPESVSDIVATIRHIWLMGPGSHLTIAARGHGHSLQGQAQAHGGLVINMESLKVPEMQVYR